MKILLNRILELTDEVTEGEKEKDNIIIILHGDNDTLAKVIVNIDELRCAVNAFENKNAHSMLGWLGG
jgi:hypothetical protein